jgi:PAS domain S-box-containing protein
LRTGRPGRRRPVTTPEEQLTPLRLQQLPEGAFVTDRQGRILFWNRAAESILGYEADEARSLSSNSLALPQSSPLQRSPDDPAARDVRVSYEGLLRHRHGHAIHVEITREAAANAAWPGDCRLFRFRDTTAEKVAAAAAWLRGHFGDCFDATPEAFLMVEIGGHIVLLNAHAERLFGYEPGELLGCAVEALVPVAARSAHHARREAYLLRPGLQAMGENASLTGLRKDGSTLPVDVMLSSLRTDAGTFVCSAIRDASGRVRHEQALQEVSRLRSEFVANMSHELRTPLNGILGFSEFMLDEKPGPLNSKQKEYLGRVLTSGRTLLRLVDGILTMSRIDAGSLTPRPETFPLREAVDEVVQPSAADAAKKGISVNIRIEPPSIRVTLDKGLLVQLLHQLISNAVKFTARGEVRIDLCTSRLAGWLLVEVSDTGPGIAPHDLEKLLATLSPSDGRSARRHEGGGLGLALASRIVALQGGSIDVATSEDAGTNVSVKLPLAGATIQ